MTREITYIIEQDEWTAGRRATAGEFLRRRGFSRHLLTYLRHHNNTLLLNNEAVFTNHPVFPGDTLTAIFTDDIPAETVVPTPMDLNIVHEDEDILVINKPPYLPIQPSLGHYENTLGNGVVAYYQSQGIPFIYRCVNRLDRNTSGLVIIAKNMASSAILYEEMKERRIRRTYFTVVHGRIDTPEGTIDLPIARKTPSLMERCVDPENGQRAVTHYTQLSRQEKNDTTALSVRLETGRTHQIRVHMSYIGHPVVGDSLYGVPSGDLIGRQALHSLKLEFMHPISRKDLTFEAPLPEDIRSLLF
jgi:23S rRNA pseudouridine1911/1915/1917 synthase